MHVLVAIDGSDPSWTALERALDHYPSATFTVLYVSDVSLGQNRVMAGGTLTEWRDEQTTHADELFERVRERSDVADVSVETVHRFGDPKRAIVSFAENADVDQIVLGSRGKQGLERLLLGSVARSVVERAPVSVLVVR